MHCPRPRRLQRRACARLTAIDALTREYREIVLHPGFSSKAEPGAISSSRCQTTRTRPSEPSRVRKTLLLDEPTTERGRTVDRQPATPDRREGPSVVRRPPAIVCFPSSDLDLRSGGARRDRTDDLLLAKQALSQLSYGPVRGRTAEDGGQIKRIPSSVVCIPPSETGGPGKI